MSNSVTREFFTRRINEEVILWKCTDWLKRCKKLVEMLVVLCHLATGERSGVGDIEVEERVG
jgi:hypothetical protein